MSQKKCLVFKMEGQGHQHKVHFLAVDQRNKITVKNIIASFWYGLGQSTTALPPTG